MANMTNSMKLAPLLLLVFIMTINVNLLDAAARRLLEPDQPATAIDEASMMELLPTILPNNTDMSSLSADLLKSVNLTDLPPSFNATSAEEMLPAALPNGTESTALMANDTALLSTVSQLQNNTDMSSLSADLLKSVNLTDMPPSVNATSAEEMLPAALPNGTESTALMANETALLSTVSQLQNNTDMSSLSADLLKSVNLTDLPPSFNATSAEEMLPAALPNGTESTALMDNETALLSTVSQLQNISLDIPAFTLPPLPSVELPSYPEFTIFGQTIHLPPFLNITAMFNNEH